MTPVIPVWLWVHVALALPSNSESFCSLSSLPKDPGWAWSVNVAIWRASLVPAHWSPQWPSVAWCIAEKPKEPISKLANIGLYYIRDVDALWQGIDHVLNSPQNKGEWYLTDAFQWMIEHGRRIRTAEVGGWYDCGALNTAIETNRILLAKTVGTDAQTHGRTEEAYRGTGARGHRKTTGRRFSPGVTILEPVLIEDDVVVEQSTIGPNVTIEAGTVVLESTVKEAIIGKRCRIEQCRLDGALLGVRSPADRAGLADLVAGFAE